MPLFSHFPPVHVCKTLQMFLLNFHVVFVFFHSSSCFKNVTKSCLVLIYNFSFLTKSWNLYFAWSKCFSFYYKAVLLFVSEFFHFCFVI